MKEIQVKTSRRREMVNITREVQSVVRDLLPADGALLLCVPHTTAAIVVNEAADPDVARDLLAAYETMVPKISFAHAEGNSDAHFLSTIIGGSLLLPVTGGRVQLGTWQGVFFVELDGPRSRRLWASAV